MSAALFVGWAKRSVPKQSPTVGTLRFAYPTLATQRPMETSTTCLPGECRGLILLCATVDQTWAPAFAGETVVMEKFSSRCTA